MKECLYTEMLLVKREAPPDLIEGIRKIEKIADVCFAPLVLLKLPANVSVWALLVGGIRLVEQEIAARGDNTPHLDATLLNASRFIPIAMRWAMQHGRRASRLASRRWTHNLSLIVNEALNTAHHYSAFLTCFPMWHKDRYAAELISDTLVRFTMPGCSRDRQVSAQQKGFAPKSGSFRKERPAKPEQTQRMQDLFSQVFQACRKTGTSRFEYDDPWNLWAELFAEYQTRLDSSFRRSEILSLGNYDLGDFKHFYGALLAVCAAHEFLCFSWEKNYGLYPCDSAVLIRPQANWATILAKLSGISIEKCKDILKDLTFQFSRSLDLHIHPFVPLGPSMLSLALAPQFPLHSRPDENILRVCSMIRPVAFDLTSLEKEPEMLGALLQTCSRYSPQGPIALPKPHPDIDLMITDENSSTVVIAELKWIRKTVRPIELVDRDADVLKGIAQLAQIRLFLTENPNHLTLSRKLPRDINEYKNVYYSLIARDHWLWVEPRGTSIIEYEAFSDALRRSENLHSTMIELLRYECLPTEGRDFVVQYDTSTANGVAIESEVFYPT